MTNELIRFLMRIEGEIGARSPALAEIIRRAREGETTPEAAAREAWIAVGDDEQLSIELEKHLLESFEIDSDAVALARLPDREQLLERWGFTEEDLVYQPHPDRPTKMLHPLLMGAILELLQFDGDVPELRTGPLPEGGSPAVPVQTMSRDPVVVGAMLRTAREQVHAELSAAQESHTRSVASLVEAVGSTNDAATLMIRRESERGVGVPGYRPGHAADLRVVDEPSALEVAVLPFEERQRLAHLALTSTQGRRSLVPVITGMLLHSLVEDGYERIRLGDSGDVLAVAEWSVQIDGGALERNPRFNFIDTAARTLLKKLQAQMGADRIASYSLQVTPVSEVSERIVGWRAVVRQSVA